MILITGAAGFIAGNLIQRIMRISSESIIAVDNFNDHAKKSRVDNFLLVDRAELCNWLSLNNPKISMVFHLGARTDTAENDVSLLRRLNTIYSQKLFNYCIQHQIPILYASSAATYGSGSFGYNDDDQNLTKLEPLNPYAKSKHQMDLWVQNQPLHPPKWYGLKFFNVYGPGEENKQKMASMVFHGYHQINQTGKISLFKSENPKYLDGEQSRDFIYIDDVIDVMIWFWKKKPASGIYNVGTGISRTFLDLSHCVFNNLNLPAKVNFIDIPQNLKHQYQHYTCAYINKLNNAGYQQTFNTLESGIEKYIAMMRKGN